MRIVLIANTVGTIYKFRFELVEELIKKEHEVFLLVQNENEDEYLNRLIKIGAKVIEVKISRRGTDPVKDFQLLLSYLKILKKIKAQKVLNYNIKPNIYASIACQILKMEYINTITGVGTALQKKNLLKFILINLYKIAFKKSDKVFFQNEENLKVFINNKIIKKEKALIVNGSGVNLERFKPQSKTKDKKDFVFLFIARIMKEKGIEEYLETAKSIKKENKNVKFYKLGL